MSLGKRLFIGEAAAAACAADTVDIFGDSSGLALYSLDYDASDAGGNYDGTPTDVTFGVDGQINWGASFNGSSSYIQTSISQNSDDVSISFWMQADSTGGAYPILMINNRNGVIVPYAFGTGSNSLTSNTQNQNILLNSTTFTSQWNHIVINMTGWASSYTAGALGGNINMEVFVNGSSIGTTTNKPYGQSDGTRLGRGDTAYFVDGKLDQVRIFNKALSQNEINTLAAETACVYTSTTDTNNYQDTITAYYKFDNSAEDETTNYDGTETNITYEFGRFGQAAVFNGTSSYVSLTDIPSSVSADISISAWINADTLSGDRTIVSLRKNRLIEISINSGYSAGQRLEFKFYDGVSNKVINLNENLITVGNWHHVCLTAQAGGNMIAYFDGVAQGSPLAIGNVYVANQSDTIGAYYVSSAGGFFDGKIDQVRIYGLLLDSTEVANLYNEKQAYITKNASDPFGDGDEEAFYKFDNNTNDSTGSYSVTNQNITFSSDSAIGTHSGYFNGSSYYVSVPHSSTFNWTNNKTLSVWVKFDAVGSLRGIVAKGSGSSPYGWVLYMTSTSKIQFVQFDSSNQGSTLASSFTVVTDKWYHVCVTGDGTFNNLYIDGSLNHSAVAVTATNESDALVFGRLYSDTNNYYHNGQIDQLRFFDRVLDGDEVFKLYAEVIN